MSRIIPILLLTVVSTGAIADWVAVGGNENGTFYADPATSRRDGDMVRMWDLLDFKSVQVTTLGKQFLSQMSHHEIDCREKRVRILETTLYSGNAEAGDVVHHSIGVGQWELVKPQTVIQILSDIACRQN